MRRFKMKKVIALLVMVVLSFSIVGCSKEQDSAPKETAQTETTTTESTTTETETVEEAFTYPMDNVSLTYFGELTPGISQVVTNLSETPFAKALTERTGVTIAYEHPLAGQAGEQFTLMVAAGDLTDIIDHNIIGAYPGGPEKAIDDGVILDLTDLLPKYAPNLWKYYQENPEVAKFARTDTGRYYSFPFIRGHESLMVFFGPVVNGQWLKDLGLEYPETMDDWTNMLRRFKNEKGATAPLTYEPSLLNRENAPFIGAYGITRGFYRDKEGNVQFGSIQPGYLEFLTTFNQWYSEGLLDVDIDSMNREQVAAKLTTGQSGASFGFAASRLGAWLAAVEDNPDIDFVGTKYPVVNRGDIPMFTQKDYPIQSGMGHAHISTKAKDVEAAMRFLDYGYSEEGNLLFNFGIEGVSYDMKDGYPTYSERILNNPDMTVVEALGIHARASYNGPFVQRKEYFEQYGFTYPQQEEANALWQISDVDKYQMPPVTPTPEESEELAMIMNEINTYRDEMQVKFIMGIESLDNYDTYVSNIKSMGIERAIEIYTAALERFNNR